jgi:hypothetical protein
MTDSLHSDWFLADQPGRVIRPAVSDEWPHIWPVYAQIVTASETYAFAEPPVVETAPALWTEEPLG